MGVDIIPVSFAVPSRVAMQFQARAFTDLQRLLAGGEDEESESADAGTDRRMVEFVPIPKDQARQLDVWDLPLWTSDDTDRARWMVNDLPWKSYWVLAFLVDHSGEYVTGRQMAEALDRDSAKSMPPAFGSLAARCRRAGRHPVWSYDPQDGYWMTNEVADLFRPFVDAHRDVERS